MERLIVLLLLAASWICVFSAASALAGCGYVPMPQLNAGQRFIMEIDQASAITNNDDDADAAKRRDDRLRGS